ncbi:MAG: ComEC/Rec2 family competence protein [Oscillospiraceae bacterium]|jgi:competence protein ComEC|nr:ComEC/Rec2 family competence protein [Oscillospiraceae bacterium]
MKRPFAILGFSYFLGLLFSLFVGVALAFYFLLFFGFLTLSCLTFRKLRKNRVFLVAFLVFSFAILAHILSFASKIEIRKVLSEKKLEVTGTICELPTKENWKYVYYIKTDSIKFLKNLKIFENFKEESYILSAEQNNFEKVIQNFSHAKLKILSNEDLHAEAFDSISLNVKTVPLEYSAGFSNASREFSKNIDAVCYNNSSKKSEVKENKNKPFRFHFLKIKENLSHIIKILLPRKYAGILNSFLLAQKDDIDKEIKSSFSKAGISHLLALSGTHMAIFSQFTIIFFDFLGLNKKIKYIGSAVVIFLFMMLIGFSPSAVRSGIMCIVYMLGMAFYKQPDSLNSLGLSIIVITFLNPFSVADIGFVLSVLATLGIILFSSNLYKKILSLFLLINLPKISFGKKIKNFIIKKIENKDKIKNTCNNLNCFQIIKQKIFKIILNILNFDNYKILDYIASTTAVSISATVLNIPILIFVFKQISTTFILTNILTSFAATLIIIFGIFSIIFYFLPLCGFVSKIFASLTSFFINYIIDCSNFSSNLPLLNFSCNKICLISTFVCVLILIVFSLIFNQNKKIIKLSVLFSFVMFFSAFAIQKILEKDKTKLLVFATNGGIYLTLEKNNRKAILSCSGKKLYSNLPKQNSENTFDFITLQNLTKENFKFLSFLNFKEKAKIILLPKDNKNLENKKNIYYYENNIDVDLWNNVKIKSIKLGKKVWIEVSINRLKALVCPENSDLAKAPLEFLNVDFLISSGNLPKNFEFSDARYVILTCEHKSYKKSLKKIFEEQKTPFSISKKSGIGLEFSKENKILFRKI